MSIATLIWQQFVASWRPSDMIKFTDTLGPEDLQTSWRLNLYLFVQNSNTLENAFWSWHSFFIIKLTYFFYKVDIFNLEFFIKFFRELAECFPLSCLKLQCLVNHHHSLVTTGKWKIGKHMSLFGWWLIRGKEMKTFIDTTVHMSFNVAAHLIHTLP